MQYAPGISYRGDVYTADAARNLSQMLYQSMTGGLRELGEGLGANYERHQSGMGQMDALNGYFDKELEPQDSVTPRDNGDGGAPELDQAGNAVSGAGSVDQHVTAGKRAQAIRSLLGTYTDNPQLMAAAKGWSTPRLEGFLRGMAMRSAMQEHAAKMEEYQALAGERKARMAQLTEQEEGDKAIGRGLNRVSKLLSGYDQRNTDVAGDGSVSDQPTQQQILGEFLGEPGLGGRNMGRALAALGQWKDMFMEQGIRVMPGPNGTSIVSDAKGREIRVIPKEDAGDENLSTTFDEDPVTGARFASRGKVMASSGFNPAKAASVQPVLVHDENGKLIGFNQTDLRGHTVFRQSRQTFDPAMDSSNNPIPGWYTDGKRMYDARTAMEKMVGPQATGTNAPAARPAAKPAAKPAAAPSGKIVVQRRENGVMKQYKLPKEQKADAIKQGYTVVSE